MSLHCYVGQCKIDEAGLQRLYYLGLVVNCRGNVDLGPRGRLSTTLPNFLIAGAAKSGTTSLYRWIRKHPDVFFPEWKEPSYFVNHYGVADWGAYTALFQPGEGKKIIGDASGSYLTGLESPEWISRELGQDLKLLILLRHPVERAFSLYRWMVMEGYEQNYPFEQALQVEDQRINDPYFSTQSPEYFWDYMYKRSSFYADTVSSFITKFGSHAVRVHLFDDVVKSPDYVYADVCRFLGIPDKPQPEFTKENPSVFPRSPRLQFVFRQIANHKSGPAPLDRAFNRVGHKLMDLNKKLGWSYNLRPETRAQLAVEFTPDLKRLEGVIDRKLPDSWYS